MEVTRALPTSSNATTWYDYAYLESTEFTTEKTIAINVNEYSSTPVPEINVRGNGVTINSGTTSTNYGYNTNLGSVEAVSATQTKSFSIENTGSAALSVTNIALSGTNATDFTITSATSKSIAAGATLALDIAFHPSSEGAKKATVTISSNDADENNYTFAISGYGFVAKNLIVSGATKPFEANGRYIYKGTLNDFQYWKHETAEYYVLNYSANAGLSHTWAIDNTIQTTDGYAFYAASSNDMPVGLTWSAGSFYPTGTSVAQNGQGTISITTETPAPEIAVTGNSFDILDGSSTPLHSKFTHFGTVDFNASGSVSRTFIISNVGISNLNVSSLAISGTDAGCFSITTLPATSITASSSSSFVVKFLPTSKGSKTAEIHIASNDGDEADFNFTLYGEAVTPRNLAVSGITNPADANGRYIYQGITNEFQYWKHTSGNYYIYNYRFANNHDPVWYIDSDRDTVGNFFKATGSSIAPLNLTWGVRTGYGGTPGIAYAEPEINVKGNSLSIVNNDAVPSEYDNTDMKVVAVTGQTVSKVFTIENLGTDPLTISNISSTGTNSAEFVVSALSATTIDPNGTATFNVTFDPTAIGLRTATITISNNDVDESSFKFSIQGTGGTLAGVTTAVATSVDITTATMNGSITDFGGNAASMYGFCYNTTGSPTTGDQMINLGVPAAVGSFSADVSALVPNTEYYVRSFVTNELGTSYGSVVVLKTLPKPPVLDISSVLNLVDTSATISVLVTEVGVPSATAFGICWNGTGSPTIADSKVDMGALSASGLLSIKLSGLEQANSYHARTFATTTAGTIYGTEFNFKTLNTQFITFDALDDADYGDSPVTLNAEANSGLAIDYESSNPDAVSIQGKTLQINNVGSAIIYAKQAGNTEYAPATAQQEIEVAQKVLSITGISAVDKTYDGNKVSLLEGTPALVGVLVADEGLVSITGTPDSKFAQAKAGKNIVVTAKGYALSGSRSGQYTLLDPAGLSADITPKPVTITGVTVADKTYDGKTSATLSGGELKGSIGADIVTIVKGSGHFVNAKVGTDKDVTASGYSISGADVANYSLAAQPVGMTANILKAPLTITAENKTIHQGQADPEFTFTFKGFVADEDESVLTSLKATRASGTKPGSYTITPSATAENYTILVKSGTLEILKSTSHIANQNHSGFNGAARLEVRDMMGRLGWKGEVEVRDGRFEMPPVKSGRWNLSVEMGGQRYSEVRIIP